MIHDPCAHLANWLIGETPWVAVKTPYLASFVNDLKSRFAARERMWITYGNVWIVAHQHADTLRDLLIVNFRNPDLCDICWHRGECAVWDRVHFDCSGHGVGGLESRRAQERTKKLDVAEAMRVLELSPRATAEEVKRAARLLALRHHPDRGGDKDVMVRVIEARDLLLSKR